MIRLLVPLLLFTFSLETMAAGNGVCRVNGVVKKIVEAKINKILLKVNSSKNIKGDGLCDQLKSESLDVTIEGKTKRIKVGQNIKLKATCYHNITPSSGVHDCHKWEMVY